MLHSKKVTILFNITTYKYNINFISLQWHYNGYTMNSLSNRKYKCTFTELSLLSNWPIQY